MEQALMCQGAPGAEIALTKAHSKWAMIGLVKSLVKYAVANPRSIAI